MKKIADRGILLHQRQKENNAYILYTRRKRQSCQDKHEMYVSLGGHRVTWLGLLLSGTQGRKKWARSQGNMERGRHSSETSSFSSNQTSLSYIHIHIHIYITIYIEDGQEPWRCAREYLRTSHGLNCSNERTWLFPYQPPAVPCLS